MSAVAQKIATSETKEYIKYKKSQIRITRFSAYILSSYHDAQKDIYNFKAQRVEYHTNNMINMLELYVASRQNEKMQENNG